MNLNSLPASKLTEAQLEELAKPLGVPGLPYPIIHYGVNASGEVVEQLSVVESTTEPLMMYSAQSYERVIGQMMREMPVPSMLPIVEEGLLRRRPEHRNKTMFMIGDAGFGKSHLAKLIGKVRDPRGPIVVDCGDRNLNDLLFETTLDHGEALRQAVDSRLLSNSLSDTRIKLLKDGLGDAFEKGGTGYAINWNIIGRQLNPAAENTTDSLTLAQRALTALEAFCRLEGIPTDNANALGLRMREGDLIRAYREGREIVLDEYNKSKEGTDRGLQTVLQFLNGEIDESIVENKLKVHGKEETYRFTFQRSEMPIGFFVTFTGNAEKDGIGTRALSRSAYDRLQPILIGDPTNLDWEHRISQLLTGLPLSTLYRIHKEQADADKDAFGKELIALRRLGLSPESCAVVSPLQITLLQHWPQTLQAVEMLAKFYEQWTGLTNPDSPLLEKQEMAQLADEIDSAYRDKVSIGFRRVIQNIEAASLMRPASKDAKQVGRLSVLLASKNTLATQETDRDVSAQFGTNLSRAILQTVGNTTVGKPQLRAFLLKLAGDVGIIDPQLQQARRSEKASLPTLLDIDPYAAVGGEVSLRALRGVLFAHLKTQHSDIQIAKPDAIPLSALAVALGVIATEEPQLLEGEHAAMPVLNENPAYGKFVGTAGIIDGAVLEEEDRKIAPARLVSVDTFAASLVLKLPNFSKDELWDVANWSEIVAEKAGKSFSNSASVAYADGSHQSGLKITTLQLRHSERNEAVTAHFLIGKNLEGKDKLLLIADGLSAGMQQHLANYNIVTVNRSNPDDAVQVDQWLSAGQPLLIKDKESLKTAFALRNNLTAADDNRSLRDLLLDGNIKATAPVMVQRHLGPQ
jgi:hypothetical protein